MPRPSPRARRLGGRVSGLGAASVGISVSSYRGLGAQSAPAAPVDAPAEAASRRPPAVRAPRAGTRRPPRPRRSPGSATTCCCARRSPRCRRRPTRAGPARGRAAADAGPPVPAREGRCARAAGRGQGAAARRRAASDGKQFVLAYSSGAALQASIQADGETDTSAMGQPVLAVIRYVLAGPYAGMVIDNSSAPARAVLPRELLEKLVEQADASLDGQDAARGRAHRRPRQPPSPKRSRACTFWVAVNRSPARARFGVAEARTDDGARLHRAVLASARGRVAAVAATRRRR